MRKAITALALASAACLGLAAPASATPTLETSQNWGGYVVPGAATEAAATFVVPSVLSSSGVASQWVGIGGWDSSTLVQAGVDEVADGPGLVLYEPWWELTPRLGTMINTMMVSSGDKMRVSINELRANEWHIQLDDLSDGDNFAKTVHYSVVAPTADFIDEDMGTGAGSLEPLATTSPVRFDGMRVNSGVSALQSAEPVELQSSLGNFVPSPLNADGFLFG